MDGWMDGRGQGGLRVGKWEVCTEGVGGWMEGCGEGDGGVGDVMRGVGVGCSRMGGDGWVNGGG